jgi:hypothetical protein
MKKNSTQPRRTINQHKNKPAGKRGAMVFEQEDIQLLYRALRAYQPTAEEAPLHEILLEQFEEILAVDFLEVPY